MARRSPRARASAGPGSRPSPRPRLSPVTSPPALARHLARHLALHACAARCVARSSSPASGPSRPRCLGVRGVCPARSGGRGQPLTLVIVPSPGSAVMNEPRTRVLSGINTVISLYSWGDTTRSWEQARWTAPQSLWRPECPGRGAGSQGSGARPGLQQCPGPCALRVWLWVPGSHIRGRGELYEVPSGTCLRLGLVRAESWRTPQSPPPGMCSAAP